MLRLSAPALARLPGNAELSGWVQRAADMLGRAEPMMVGAASR